MEKEIEIIELYNSNLSIKLICEKLNVSHGKVYNVLNKNKVQKNKHKRKLRKTKIDYDKIVEMYISGMSIDNISRELEISNGTIYKALSNIDLRGSRKYLVNEDYFTSIDTEDKAYFLGLLYSDGCNNGDGFYITLQDRDVKILEKFKECVGYDGSLRYSKSKNNQKYYYSLNISSVKMSKILENIGCNKNKTINGVFPNNIPDELMNHFIRGIFDGDGSIWKSGNQFGFSIIGNSNIIKVVSDIINYECSIDVRIRKPKRYKSDISVYSFGGNKQIKRVKEYLYKNSTIYLERKYLKFKENGDKEYTNIQRDKNPI